MQTGLDEIRSLRRSDRAKLRKRVIAMVIIAIVLLAVMTCLRTTKTGFVNPLNAAKNLFNAARLFLAQIFHWDIYKCPFLLFSH